MPAKPTRPRRADLTARRGCTMLVTAALLLIIACSRGPERSTASFCSTMKSEKARISRQLEANTANAGGDLAGAFAALGATAQAIGELRVYFDKLAKVAPAEIRTETEILAEEFDEQLDQAASSAANPLLGLGTAFLESATISGPLERVSEFAMKNCGEPV